MKRRSGLRRIMRKELLENLDKTMKEVLPPRFWKL